MMRLQNNYSLNHIQKALCNVNADVKIAEIQKHEQPECYSIYYLDEFQNKD